MCNCYGTDRYRHCCGALERKYRQTSDEALEALRRKLSGPTPDEALETLQKAVTAARRAGFDVKCEATRKVVTTL